MLVAPALVAQVKGQGYRIGSRSKVGHGQVQHGSKVKGQVHGQTMVQKSQVPLVILNFAQDHIRANGGGRVDAHANRTTLRNKE